jgi:hypothetical protein
MTLSLEKLATIATLWRGDVLSWAERGILLGEIMAEVSGNKKDERVCFAIEANHNIVIAGATRFEQFYPELRLPSTPYIIDMQQGRATLRRPTDKLPETVRVLVGRLQKYLRRQLIEENSFDCLIDELRGCPMRFICREEIELRIKKALCLLEDTYEQILKVRIRRYMKWQEIRAEIEKMCAEGNPLIEEIHFNRTLATPRAQGLSN